MTQRPRRPIFVAAREKTLANSLSGKRILIVLESLDLGGAESQALMLARYLAHELGSRVELWGLGAAGRAAELCGEIGIPCRRVAVRIGRAGWPGTLIALAGFARKLWRARPEVVLPYTLLPNVLCASAAPLAGARLCVWNQRDVGIGKIGRRLERWAIRRARRIVANSRSCAWFLTEEMAVEAGRVRIIPNGVELASPEGGGADWRGRLGVGREALLVSMVANLHANKDHSTLLRAWRIAQDRWPVAARPGFLLLAGSHGETYPGLCALAGKLGLGDRVRFLGPVDDVAGLLGAVDLGAFSSKQEGCPNGVLECMAAGLAVVGSDIPAIRDVVDPEGGALLAPPGDASAMAERILAAASDPRLRSRIGEANRRRAKSEFSPRRMCEAMADLIADGLS